MSRIMRIFLIYWFYHFPLLIGMFINMISNSEMSISFFWIASLVTHELMIEEEV